MKYKKCSRCALNYVLMDEDLCKVCKDELAGKGSLFDDDFDNLICPFCGKNPITIDEVMCAKCKNKRNFTKDDR